MSSSCLSGGRAAYGFDLDIVVKPSLSPATSTRSTHSSPSSTLSESSNSPFALSTKRARTPRKRPNQTYNEAAALLSTVYPKVFSAKSLPKLCNKKNTRRFGSFSESPAELLPPFPALGDAGFLLHRYVPDEPSPRIEPRPTSSSERSLACLSPVSAEFREPNSPAGLDDDFDAESILDEEVGEGIDSIMGNLSVNNNGGGGGGGEDSRRYSNQVIPYLGHPMGYGFGGVFKFGYRHAGNMRRALRRADDGEWWRSPTVEVLKIAPKLKPAPVPATPSSAGKKKKKVRKVEKVEKLLDKAGKVEEKAAAEPPKAETVTATTAASTQQQQEAEAAAKLKPALDLKLNYEEVLKAWSGRGSPFSNATDSSESPTDTIARLWQMDLFPEGAGGVREASVLRYREKRRTRLFSKKIRYQVRKVNADRRPRMKASGRFARRPSQSP